MNRMIKIELPESLGLQVSNTEILSESQFAFTILNRKDKSKQRRK